MKKIKIDLRKVMGIFFAIIAIFITIFSNVMPVLAEIATGKYIARIYETPYSDNLGQNVFKIRVQGDEIPKLQENGFGQTAFCMNFHMDHPETLTTLNRSDEFTKTSDFINSARISYLAYYRYSNANGNASKSLTGRDDNVQYAYTAILVWQKLGQVPNSYSLGTDFDKFKSDIMDEFNKWDTQPSFEGSTQTLNLGETKTLTDKNNVLKYYESFNYTKNKVTFNHTKGSNDLKITVAKDATEKNVSITKTDAINNNMGKNINNRTVKTNFVLTPLSDDKIHQRLIVAYGYNDPKYLSINVNLNLYGDIEIAKKDNKGNFIPNTTFKVSYNSDMSAPIGTYTTGANGKVTVKNVKPGTIYIQEINVPEQLILDNTIHTVTVNANSTVTYTATNNWKQGYIKVIKKDAETGKIVKKSGTVFDIYNSKNQKVSSITTNNEGIAISGPLDYGNYTVKESTAPDKYTINVKVSDSIGVLENNKTYEIIISNKRVRGSVTIHKEDSKNGTKPLGEATLKGAVYGIYARTPILDPADNSVLYDTDEKILELTTDNNASAIANDLYLGQYYLKEIIPSNGYTLDSNKYNFDLSYENQNSEIVTKTVTVKERVKSQAFEIIKISSEGVGETELLEGAEFTIKFKNDVEKYGSWDAAPIAINADGKTATKLITDNKGYAISERLPFGTYIVRETKVPNGKLGVADFEIVISEDSSKPQVWRVFNDTSFESIIKIVKKDANTNKTVLVEGATFKIKNLDTNEYFGYWEWNPSPHYVDSWTTDKTGTVMTGRKLKAGNYQLEEQKSPKGYLISEEPVPFKVSYRSSYQTLDDGQTVVITVSKENISVNGQIHIEKRGEVLKSYENGKFIYEEKGLPNAKYEIIAKEDILDPADKSVIYKAGTIVDTVITDAEGQAISKKLPLGEYLIREVQAPKGYVLNKEEKSVLLEYKDQYTSLVFEDITFVNDRQKVNLILYKKDKDTNVGVLGAEFELYAKEDIINYNNEIIVKAGELIAKAISDENGFVNFNLDLPFSKYEIKETKAPLGYILNEEIILADATYKGNDEEIITIDFNNKPTQMIFSKIDEINGEELPGAIIQIIDKKSGKIIDEWETNGEKHIVKYLEEGKEYIMRETKAPDGYKLSEDITFIAGDGKEIIMKNVHEPVIQTGNETNYLLLSFSFIISVVGIITMINKKFIL